MSAPTVHWPSADLDDLLDYLDHVEVDTAESLAAHDWDTFVASLEDALDSDPEDDPYYWEE